MDEQDLAWKSAQADPNFYKSLLDNLNDAVYFVDRERRIIYWNRGAAQLTGFTSDQVQGRFCHDDLLCHVDGAGKHLCFEGCPLSLTIADGEPREAQVFLRHRNGHRVPVKVRVNPIQNGKGEIVGAVEIFTNDTARLSALRKAEEMERLAFLDPLTQVPNRRYLEIRLQTMTHEFELHRDPFGLLLIDVDHFKQINDRYGHAAGDRALLAVARTLTGALRSTDELGRWGGDEFMAIIGHTSRDSLSMLCERCCRLVQESTVAHGAGRIPVSISIGGALFRGKGESLIECADRMLYRSKASGRGRWAIDAD